LDGIKNVSPYASGRLLDIGCGTKPYEPFLKVESYEGLEIESSNNLHQTKHDSLYDGQNLPFASDSFDTIISTQVLEHSFNPDKLLSEIQRVLKPHSYLILTVPFIWDEHEQPYDYARYTSFGIIHLLEKNNLEVIIHEKLCTGIPCLVQILNVYIYKIILSKLKIPKIFHKYIYLTLNIIGFGAQHLIPKSDDMYLDNLVVAKKITPPQSN